MDRMEGMLMKSDPHAINAIIPYSLPLSHKLPSLSFPLQNKSRHRSKNVHRTVVFEHQTTTDEDNNGELFRSV